MREGLSSTENRNYRLRERLAAPAADSARSALGRYFSLKMLNCGCSASESATPGDAPKSIVIVLWPEVVLTW
jgi:hypothetical protein